MLPEWVQGREFLSENKNTLQVFTRCSKSCKTSEEITALKMAHENYSLRYSQNNLPL